MSKQQLAPSSQQRSQGRRPSGSARSTGPGRSAQSGSARTRPVGARQRTAPADAGTGARRSLERASAGPLLRLHAMPRWLIPLAMGVLLAGGLLIPAAWAGLLLAVLALFLTWLVLLSWPVLATPARVLRVVVVVVVAVAAVWRLTGHA